MHHEGTTLRIKKQEQTKTKSPLALLASPSSILSMFQQPNSRETTWNGAANVLETQTQRT
jgi:hypothetical protein